MLKVESAQERNNNSSQPRSVCCVVLSRVLFSSPPLYIHYACVYYSGGSRFKCEMSTTTSMETAVLAVFGGCKNDLVTKPALR